MIRIWFGKFSFFYIFSRVVSF